MQSLGRAGIFQILVQFRVFGNLASDPVARG